MASGQERGLGEEAGFSIVESTLALGLVFTVLVGLLASLPAGVEGVITGRQRHVALAIAGEVMEQARGRSYAEVGHDLDSDPTLTGDPTLSGSFPDYVFTEPEPDEPLAGSSLDAGATAGTTTNPLYPFSPHRWSTLRDGTTYTSAVYVSLVQPGTGAAYKRLTVTVTWDRAQHPEDVLPASVKLSSLLFDADPPAEQQLRGVADSVAGTVTVTGSLSGIGLSDTRAFLPYARGEIDSRFLRQARGYAGTGRSQVNLVSGTASGCTVSNEGRTADCPGAKAETSADDGYGAAPFEYDQLGPVTDAGGTTGAGTALATTLSQGTATSRSAARSCWACDGAGPDDDDRLPYQWSEATGPFALTMGFSAGSVSGSLASVPAPCSSGCATAVVDRDDVGASPVVVAAAAASHPAIDVVTIQGAPAAFAGMVRVGATSASAVARAGVGAAAPSVGGNAVAVQVYDGALAGYRSLSVTPGTPSEATSHAEFPAGAATVVMDATVRSTAATVSSTTDAGSVARAEVGLTSWLQVEVHVVITEASGTVADLTVLVDYGRLSARSDYTPS